jgi:hypothetical protein
MYVLHTGSVSGLATRVVWAGAGLGLVLAAVTGAMLWWRRLINAVSSRELVPKAVRYQASPDANAYVSRCFDGAVGASNTAIRRLTARIPPKEDHVKVFGWCAEERSSALFVSKVRHCSDRAAQTHHCRRFRALRSNMRARAPTSVAIRDPRLRIVPVNFPRVSAQNNKKRPEWKRGNLFSAFTQDF